MIDIQLQRRLQLPAGDVGFGGDLPAGEQRIYAEGLAMGAESASKAFAEAEARIEELFASASAIRGRPRITRARVPA